MGRAVASFYLEESVSQAFREYARRVPGKTVGEVLEDALLEYMAAHPVELFVAPIQIEIRDNLQGWREEIRASLLAKKIRHLCQVVKRIDETGVGEREKWAAELSDLLLRAAEVKSSDEEFLNVLREAYELVR